MNPEIKNMVDNVIKYDGIEVHESEWELAKQVVQEHPGFRLGSPRGPGRAWRRLEMTGPYATFATPEVFQTFQDNVRNAALEEAARSVLSSKWNYTDNAFIAEDIRTLKKG